MHSRSKVSDIQNLKLSQKIQIAEIKKAISNMENEKSPGVDELPIEFHKEFFEIIKQDLQITFNKALLDLKLTPKTWNQDIIALIIKNGI